MNLEPVSGSLRKEYHRIPITWVPKLENDDCFPVYSDNWDAVFEDECFNGEASDEPYHQ